MKKKRIKYHKIKDGEWVFPAMTGYRLRCCDCGLIHYFDFAVVDGDTYELINKRRVAFRAYRVNKKGEIKA